MLSAFVDNYRPFYPFQFKRKGVEKKLKKALQQKSSKQLIFFMQAIEGVNWSWFFEELGDRSAIFLFPNLNTLVRCIFQREFAEHCLGSTVRSLLLNGDLNRQWKAQEGVWLDLENFYWTFLEEDSLWKEYKKPFENWLLNHQKTTTRLYTLGKQLCNSWKQSHLGKHRGLAFYRDRYYETLYDYAIQAELSSLQGDSSPLYLDPKVLENFEIRRHPRTLEKKNIFRVAHVVKVLVDQRIHAPTQRLLSLLKNYSEEKFELTVISVEQNTLRLEDYPSTFYQQSSLLIGSEVLGYLREGGMNVYVDYHPKSQEDSAKKIFG